MTAIEWLGVALAGAVGALARVGVDTWVAPRRSAPFATAAVNVSGAAALGLIDGLALSPSAGRLIGTALLGAYTTFSTWMLQAEQLRVAGRTRQAAVTLALPLFAGFGAIALGRALVTGG